MNLRMIEGTRYAGFSAEADPSQERLTEQPNARADI